METLPPELLQKIITHLPLPTLKSLRQVSHLFANLGADQLLPSTFKHRPHQPSISYLTSISQHPIFRHKIKTIRFLHGEINEYHARHNTYFRNFMLEPYERDIVMRGDSDRYLALKDRIQRYFERSCDEDVLTGVFGELDGLEGVFVELGTWAYGDMEGLEGMRGIWGIPTTRLLRRGETVKRWRAILGALNRNVDREGWKLGMLGHDQLPFEFCTQDSAFLRSVEPVFRGLKKLELVLVEDTPNETLYAKGCLNLARLLRCAVSVQELKLGFEGRSKKSINMILESLEEDSFFFPHLKKFSLHYCTTTCKGLGDFLIRHKELLREVQLGDGQERTIQFSDGGERTIRRSPRGGIHLEDGSWRELAGRVRMGIPACEVLVMGDLEGIESGECWVLEHNESWVGLPGLLS